LISADKSNQKLAHMQIFMEQMRIIGKEDLTLRQAVKTLSLDNERKASFSFALSSLNRIFVQQNETNNQLLIRKEQDEKAIDDVGTGCHDDRLCTRTCRHDMD
jgi:hypothetical protein